MPASLVPAKKAEALNAMIAHRDMTAHWPRRRIAFNAIFYSS
jgi:hypothetical protein